MHISSIANHRTQLHKQLRTTVPLDHLHIIAIIPGIRTAPAVSSTHQSQLRTSHGTITRDVAPKLVTNGYTIIYRCNKQLQIHHVPNLPKLYEKLMAEFVEAELLGTASCNHPESACVCSSPGIGTGGGPPLLCIAGCSMGDGSCCCGSNWLVRSHHS